MNLNSYFFKFEPTNNEAINDILSAVARAGKAYHHTSQWADENDLGVSERDRIQLAAIVAAKTIEDLKGTIEKLESRLERIENCKHCSQCLRSDQSCSKCG